MKVLEHLHSRHLDTKAHIVWVNDAENVATWPLLNLSGQMVGYQQYRPDRTKKRDNHPKESRYFSYLKKDEKGVWGLESWKFSNTLFVTEGVFDACRITALGHSAIATLSNDPKYLRNWFYMLNRPIVAVCDNDPAGLKLAKYGNTSAVVPEGDLGDAPQSYIMELLNEYSPKTC